MGQKDNELINKALEENNTLIGNRLTNIEENQRKQGENPEIPPNVSKMLNFLKPDSRK